MLATYTKQSGIAVPSEMFTDTLRAALTTRNEEKERARRMNLWGWQKMPDEVGWYRTSSCGGYRVPHGLRFRIDTPERVAGFGHRIEDKVVDERFEMPDFMGALYEPQHEAMTALLVHNVGLVHAPTGAGKGVMIPWLVSTLRKKSIVVVPNVQLLNEMTDRFVALLGIVPTRVGGTTKKPQRDAADPRVTVATIQSAVKMSPKELSSFGLAVFDECDKAVTTDDRTNLLWNLRPTYMYGFTGTVSLNHMDPKVLRMWFGPVTKMTSHNFTPTCYRVHTPFRTYKDLSAEKDFTELNTDLLNDPERDRIIADVVARSVKLCETKKGIVLTNRVEHAQRLADLIEKEGVKAFVIVGEDSAEERQAAKDAVASNKDPVVLVGSTQIVGRGFDLPPLQMAYVCYPNRFDANVVQMVGRVLRKFPGKTYAKVYDFVDTRVKILLSQANGRLRAMKKEYGPTFKHHEITSYL